MDTKILKAVRKDLYETVPAYIDEYLGIYEVDIKRGDLRAVSALVAILRGQPIKLTPDLKPHYLKLKALLTGLPQISKEDSLCVADRESIDTLIKYNYHQKANALIKKYQLPNDTAIILPVDSEKTFMFKPEKDQNDLVPQDFPKLTHLAQQASALKRLKQVGKLAAGFLLSPIVGMFYGFRAITKASKNISDGKETWKNSLKVAAIVGAGYMSSIQGAGIGALVGTMIAPGLGTVIGGFTGSILGAGFGAGISAFLIKKVGEGVNKLLDKFHLRKSPAKYELNETQEKELEEKNYDTNVIHQMLHALQKAKDLMTKEDIRDLLKKIKRGELSEKVAIGHFDFYPKKTQDENRPVYPDSPKHHALARSKNEIIPLSEERDSPNMKLKR